MVTVETIAQYYARRFGVPLADVQGHTRQAAATVETPCGLLCKQAIDAAADLIDHAKQAGVAYRVDVREVRSLVREVVLIYVYG